MTKSNKRKLYKSKDDKVIGGILGGLGNYFDIDSNLLRLIGLLFLVFTGFAPFLIIYFVAMFIIPSNRERTKKEETSNLIENTMEEKNEIKKEAKEDDDSPGGLFITAGVLGGMGFGFLFGNLLAGLFIGLGIGFALSASYEIFRTHKGKNKQ